MWRKEASLVIAVEISSNIVLGVWKMVSDLGNGIIPVIKRVEWR